MQLLNLPGILNPILYRKDGTRVSSIKKNRDFGVYMID
jgi:hypothetical protein